MVPDATELLSSFLSEELSGGGGILVRQAERQNMSSTNLFEKDFSAIPIVLVAAATELLPPSSSEELVINIG